MAKIAIDAGHGGADPGMIGCDGIEEKGINLQIALKLKTLLEDHNITLGDGYLRLVYQMVDDNGTPFRDELKTDLSRRSLMITEEMVLLLIFWRLMSTNGARWESEKDCPPYWLLATCATICVVTLQAVKKLCGFSISVWLITVPF